MMDETDNAENSKPDIKKSKNVTELTTASPHVQK